MPARIRPASCALIAWLVSSGCSHHTPSSARSEADAASTARAPGVSTESRTADMPATAAPALHLHLPLQPVADVDMPGGATRFDYQDVDVRHGHLVIAHMNDGAVLIVKLSDGSVVKQLTGIPVARGVAVADSIGIIFVTSSPDQLVLIDGETLRERGRVQTGRGPDGVAWDPADRIVGVSDQRDGALSLIADAGAGDRTQVPLGTETGNVVYDAGRGWFWITVVGESPPDALVAVDPKTAAVQTRIALPGCSGAHGLRLHPDGRSAFIACESNAMLARVDLGSTHTVTTGATGSGPDVLAIDPDLQWLYVASESGELAVFDLARSGVTRIGEQQPGDHAHSIAVDPASHRVFFPLQAGPAGTPVLRIMRPTAGS